MPDTSPDSPCEAWAERLETAADRLTALLTEPNAAARLRVREGDDDWSAAQVLGHVVEMLPYWTHQCQRLMAAAEPPSFGRSIDSPSRLAGPARGASADTGYLLTELRREAAAGAAFIRRLAPDDLTRQGHHPRRGLMTVADIVESFVVGHIEEHLAQAQAVLTG